MASQEFLVLDTTQTFYVNIKAFMAKFVTDHTLMWSRRSLINL